ncbi:MAG: CHAD domain-containing protein [Hyphomicrobiaceae bacterium]|nr:CHAD domain-containing protein [Hyphomicrobiaceae bacterium]
MAYRFKLKETLEAGVRRIATEQLDKAIAAPSAGADRVVWVHETRKTVKRVRALLRLVRSGLPSGEWQRENCDLREVARLLSPLRDRHVMRDTIASLHADADKRLLSALAWLEGESAAGGAGELAATADPDAAVGKAVAQLAAARDRLAGLDLDGTIVEVAGAGLAATQRAGRKALAAAEADPSDENLHELRKAVQTCWRQSALVEAAWPEIMSVRQAVARDLSQTLGEVQDLAVLAAAAAARADDSDQNRRDAERIVKACKARQARLHAASFPAVHRLFALPPKSVSAELARCWPASSALAVEEARQARVAAKQPLAADRDATLRIERVTSPARKIVSRKVRASG